MSNLDKILSSLNKKYKSENLLTRATDQVVEVEWIPTNIFFFFLVMGKGLPRGRIVEIWGPPASGKSTTALQIISAVQKQGGLAAYIDAECTYDTDWAEACGVDNSNLALMRPDTGEQALDMIIDLVNTGEMDVIILDSIPGLLPTAVDERSIGDPTVGAQARMITTFLQKVNPRLSKTKTSLILINQTRTKIGVMYGDPTSLPGGQAITFYASIILRVNKDKKRITTDKVTGDPVGHAMEVKNTKNKVASPGRQTSYMFYYRQGADNQQAIVDEALAKGVIVKPEKGGKTYTVNVNGVEHKIVGSNNIIEYLRENKEVADYVIEKAEIPEYYRDAFSKERVIDEDTVECKEMTYED